MASIRQRGTGKWQVRWRQDGKAASETFATRKQAFQFRGLVDAAGQRYPKGWVPRFGFVEKAATGPTLAEWFERSVASRPGPSTEARQRYQRQFDRYVPSWLAGKRLDEITTEDAGLWFNELRAQPIAGKTVRNVHGTLSSAVKHAVDDGLIARNPFRGLTRGVSARPSSEMVCLAEGEFAVLCAAMSDRYRPFTEFLFGTGLRFGEATASRPQDVDLANGRLNVREAWKREADGAYVLGDPKTLYSIRNIAISERLCEILEPLVTGRSAGLLFPNARGERIRNGTFHLRHWQPAVRAAQEAGLTKRPRVHDLRHSHASILLNAGVPMLAVSRRLGHASVLITDQRYSHLLPESDAAVRAVLGRL